MYHRAPQNEALQKLLAIECIGLDSTPVKVPLLLLPFIWLELWFDRLTAWLGTGFLEIVSRLPQSLIVFIGKGIDCGLRIKEKIKPIIKRWRKRILRWIDRMVVQWENFQEWFRKKGYALLCFTERKLGKPLNWLGNFLAVLMAWRPLSYLGYRLLLLWDILTNLLNMTYITFTYPPDFVVRQKSIRSFMSVLKGLDPRVNLSQIEQLIEQAIKFFQWLVDEGYGYDCELRLNNIGWMGNSNHPQLVLLDPGALISPREVRPDEILQFLRQAKEDFSRCAHLHEIERIIGRDFGAFFREQYREMGEKLFDRWIGQLQVEGDGKK